MRNVLDECCRKKFENVLCLLTFFFSKIVPLCNNVEKCGRAGQVTDDNMANARCSLDN